MSGREGPSRRQILAGLGVLTAASALPRGGFAADAPLSLRNATVLTHDGQLLQDHGLRVEDGKVVEIAPSAQLGADAVDLGGAWICPGFTDAGCKVGLYEVDLEKATHDDDESSNTVTPDARVRDGYNPASEVIPVTRANGITSVLVHPDDGNLISGQAALFRTVGDTVDEALVLAPAALCINLGHAPTGKRNGAPASRMGVAMKLRDLLEETRLPEKKDAGEDHKKKKKGGDGGGGDGDGPKPDSKVDPATRVLRDLKRGKLRALIRAERADDVLFAVELAQEWKLDAILLGGSEAWKVARTIADAKIPLFLGPLNVQPDSFEHLDARYDNAALLHAAGVELAFRTGAAHFSRGLPSLAALTVAFGLPYEVAIHALTSAAWDALGVSGGRLEQGSEATFFVVDGDPLQPRFPLRRMWVQGREVSLETRQSRLYQDFKVLR